MGRSPSPNAGGEVFSVFEAMVGHDGAAPATGALAGADGASATALQPPPHLVTTASRTGADGACCHGYAGHGRGRRRRGTDAARGRAGRSPPKVGAPDPRFAAAGPCPAGAATHASGATDRRPLPRLVEASARLPRPGYRHQSCCDTR